MTPRYEQLPSLREIDYVAAKPGVDHARIDAIRQDVLDELELIRVDAEIALEHSGLHDDLRLSLLAFVISTARLHGRTNAQQLAVFLADRDELFAELMFRCTGLVTL